MQTQSIHIHLSIGQANKLNQALPKGFKLTTREEFIRNARIITGTSNNPLGFVEVIKLWFRLKRHPYMIRFLRQTMLGMQIRDIDAKIRSTYNYSRQDLKTDVGNFYQKICENHQSNQLVHQHAIKLQNYLEGLLVDNQNNQEGQSGISDQKQNQQTVIEANSPSQIKSQSCCSQRLPTNAQKMRLGVNIRKLSSQGLQDICLMIFKQLQNKLYCFDLEKLSVNKFRQVQSYVKQVLSKQNKCEQSFQDCEIQNDSDWMIDSDRQ